MKRCLHQFIRPKRKNPEKTQGVGECTECEYDLEENKKCKQYLPVNFQIIEVDPEQISESTLMLEEYNCKADYSCKNGNTNHTKCKKSSGII
jgi:hypothetical protein